MNYRITAPQAINANIKLPASKSISARALVIRALCPTAPLPTGIAMCDDTDALMRGLDTTRGRIDVGAAGTAMRFLTAFHAARPGNDVTIDGCERMCERPIAPLVDALRQLGANIDYAGREGFPPLHITGTTLSGGRSIIMPGNVSSQFTSALMMIGPTIGGLEIELTGDIVSAPYIDMTMAIMRHYSIDCRWTDRIITIPAGEYHPEPLDVEADWSAASYWMALQALLPNSRISLTGLQPDSWQGDSRMLTFMQQMGMRAQWAQNGALSLDMANAACCCCSTFADLNGTPDLAPTMIVMLCLMGRPFRITGLSTLVIKESNRIEALQQELSKLGYCIQIEGNDAVSWHFQSCAPQSQPCIDTHGDHRIAMAMALASARWQGIVMSNAEVVGKSYPTYWKDLSHSGFIIEQI